ncbi:hypothetical protein V1264_010871 [Littorina saxatilis]|uniref:Uncharacterized protein n=1 Tax=Littorina saxatilis TaxID=31220 RepID=A0AAN9GJV0_9CAEN
MLNGNMVSPKTNSKRSATQSFIHYTNEQGWKSIDASGEIRISTRDSGKAHYGEGVYGTTLRPEEGKMRIAKNNWFFNNAKNYVASGKVDVAIELEIPAEKVQKVGQWYRDILLHVGPIRLNDYKYKVRHI